jgi:hypothetical protein
MNPFVKINSPFEKRWAKFLDYRWPTTKMALNLFEQYDGMTIVETGCIRQADDNGAGYSTYVYADYLKSRGTLGRLITVDIDKIHMDICKGLTTEFVGLIHYVVQDSVEYLISHSGRIDFLYLDSYDYPIVEVARLYDGTFDDVLKKMWLEDENKVRAVHPEFNPPQEHCLDEIKAAMPHLHDRSVVMLDDNRFPGGGKPRLAKEYLADNGWVCLLDDGQSVWIRR